MYFKKGMNVGLTIPAMSLKVPKPSFPSIKVDAQVKMPPKPQSLKSLLPKFKYNIPTFGDDYHMGMEYAASNQQSVGISPAYRHNQHNQFNLNDQMHLNLNSQMNNQMQYNFNNQMNRLNHKPNQFRHLNQPMNNVDLYSESSNHQNMNYLNDNNQQFNMPIRESARFQESERFIQSPQFQYRNLQSMNHNRFNQIRSSMRN